MLSYYPACFSQAYASWNSQQLTLKNESLIRLIQLPSGTNTFGTSSLQLAGDKLDFVRPGSEDFSFSLNGKILTGGSAWNCVKLAEISDSAQGSGACVTLERPEDGIRIEVCYLLYPRLPLVRKKIVFINTGTSDIRIEDLDLECIRFENSGTGTESWVMHDYGRQKALGQFVGNWYDPVIVVHQVNRRRGIALGNEAPGVMKRSDAFLKRDLITAGLTHHDQNFAFRKWLKPGEQWESPWVFSALYADSDDPYEVLNGTVNDYVRRHMGIRLQHVNPKPTFVYNTWEPFWHKINEKMIMELADAAAECGIEEFIIDDGWQSSYGDWGIDSVKFPHGLKPVFDYIRSKGMKPGVWISLAAAEPKSRVFKEHPEWLVRKADGTPINLHDDVDKMYEWESYSMCMTTGWFDYIKSVILKMVNEYGLEYIKADFAAVTGAYTTDKTRSGCHATNHPMHRDRNESMLGMYRRTWQLFDELHKEAPSLFIDCTFETMGALQLIDFDMCKHAEGNWLSNFGEKAPLGALRVRQMSWWRSPVIPATAMVIGNQRFDDPQFELSLMSLAGSLPIVLGDPRLLSATQRARMKSWSDWLRVMQQKHDFMSYRQDLKGYGEPAEGNWDGFQRINTETKSGGIVGLFRQGSAEQQRVVTVQFLDTGAVYEVREALSGRMIWKGNGRELASSGFTLVLKKQYDGALLEISRIP